MTPNGKTGPPWGPRRQGRVRTKEEAPLGRGAGGLPIADSFLGYPLPAGTARGTYRVRGGEPSPTRKKGGVYDPGGS